MAGSYQIFPLIVFIKTDEMSINNMLDLYHIVDNDFVKLRRDLKTTTNAIQSTTLSNINT